MSRLVESLESRRLMHAEFAASINFAPITARRAPGLLADYGAAYGVRRGGLSYGWTSDATAGAVERDLTKVQKNDTFVAMQAGGNKSWEIGVENGTYDVYVVAGDPGAVNDRMAITVEGQVAVSGVTKSKRRYLEGKTTVNVTDGRITVGNADYAVADKICYLAIASTEQTTANTLNVTASVPNAAETGPVSGRFTVTRGGDLDEAVVVPLGVTGTATNGVDYGRIGRSIVFAAGVESINLKVGVIGDTADESNETVVLTLGATDGYALVEPSATVTIRDAVSTAAPATLTWSTAAARPVAASELQSAVVGGKLYTFGGFVDSTYKPTKANYAYDPATNAWARKADLPVGVTHAGVASDGTGIYFAGGYPGNGSGGSQTFSTTAVYRYDPAADAYTALPGLPAARGAGALGMVGSVLYFLGGDNPARQDVTDVYALNLNDLASGWVTRASLPAARNHAAAVTLDGSLYLIGGQTDQDQDLTTHADAYRYDPAANAWTTVASMPGGRSHITDAAFVHEGKIVILGGQSAFESPLSSNLEYDPAANAWRTIASLPTARFSGGGDLVGGKFVYAGGYNGGFKNNTYVGTLT